MYLELISVNSSDTLGTSQKVSVDGFPRSVRVRLVCTNFTQPKKDETVSYQATEIMTEIVESMVDATESKSEGSSYEDTDDR